MHTHIPPSRRHTRQRRLPHRVVVHDQPRPTRVHLEATSQIGLLNPSLVDRGESQLCQHQAKKKKEKDTTQQGSNLTVEKISPFSVAYIVHRLSVYALEFNRLLILRTRERRKALDDNTACQKWRDRRGDSGTRCCCCGIKRACGRLRRLKLRLHLLLSECGFGASLR